MMEVLQFIFSSFWIWAGSVVILSLLVSLVAALASAVFGRARS
jgi:hypothetical protein